MKEKVRLIWREKIKKKGLTNEIFNLIIYYMIS